MILQKRWRFWMILGRWYTMHFNRSIKKYIKVLIFPSHELVHIGFPDDSVRIIPRNPGILIGSPDFLWSLTLRTVAFCFNGGPHDDPCQAGCKDVKAQDSEKIVAHEAWASGRAVTKHLGLVLKMRPCIHISRYTLWIHMQYIYIMTSYVYINHIYIYIHIHTHRWNI